MSRRGVLTLIATLHTLQQPRAMYLVAVLWLLKDRQSVEQAALIELLLAALPDYKAASDPRIALNTYRNLVALHEWGWLFLTANQSGGPIRHTPWSRRFMDEWLSGGATRVIAIQAWKELRQPRAAALWLVMGLTPQDVNTTTDLRRQSGADSALSQSNLNRAFKVLEAHGWLETWVENNNLQVRTTAALTRLLAQVWCEPT